MQPIEPADVQKALEALHPILQACHVVARDRWNREVRPLFPTCTRRGRRVIINELITQEARTRLASVHGVRIIETKKGHFLVSVIGAEITLRFKKVDEDSRPSNYPTPSSLRFDRQEPLPGIPRGVRLNIGYRVDDLETEMEGPYVIFSIGRTVIWFYEIENPTAGQTVLPFPSPSTQPGPRVAPKPGVVPEIKKKPQQ